MISVARAIENIGKELLVERSCARNFGRTRENTGVKDSHGIDHRSCRQRRQNLRSAEDTSPSLLIQTTAFFLVLFINKADVANTNSYGGFVSSVLAFHVFIRKTFRFPRSFPETLEIRRAVSIFGHGRFSASIRLVLR